MLTNKKATLMLSTKGSKNLQKYQVYFVMMLLAGVELERRLIQKEQEFENRFQDTFKLNEKVTYNFYSNCMPNLLE